MTIKTVSINSIKYGSITMSVSEDGEIVIGRSYQLLDSSGESASVYAKDLNSDLVLSGGVSALVKLAEQSQVLQEAIAEIDSLTKSLIEEKEDLVL